MLIGLIGLLIETKILRDKKLKYFVKYKNLAKFKKPNFIKNINKILRMDFLIFKD